MVMIWFTQIKNIMKKTKIKHYLNKKIITTFYKNGNVWEQILYTNNKVHDLSKEWWSNGKKHYETPYVNGNRYGLEVVWHDNGNKRINTTFKKDLEHGAKIAFNY